jgi:hypothetical protein
LGGNLEQDRVKLKTQSTKFKRNLKDQVPSSQTSACQKVGALPPELGASFEL